jgi:sucrose phosphorylase
MKPAVHLVTYADRLAGDLPGLRQLLDGRLRGVFAGVHILPFFRPFDGADAGFDPEDHTEVDSRLGSWDDVADISGLGEVMVDLIVNHMSINSPQFKDFSAHGDASAYSGMFLTLDQVFPRGATEADLLTIYRPGPKLPFTPVTLGVGRQRLLWTTFTDQQVDLNVADPQAVAYLQSILEQMAASGVTTVRLDAVGYAVKRAGTSCFMIPETFTFIDDVTDRARALGMRVLVEVHSHYQTQVDISGHVDYIYDFALPPLLLHALFHADAAPLADWLNVRPLNVVSVLDTHDGIGVIDAATDAITGAPGLLSDDQVKAVVAGIHQRCGGDSLLATGAAADNIDSEQVNCTFFEAVGRDEERYLLARAVQFFLPGAAQVYYVGLLAGHNDLKLLADTGTGRDINRHYYDPEELETALATTVVQRLLDLIELRNNHAAFAGTFDWHQPDPTTLLLTWTCDRSRLQLHADFAQGSFTVTEEPAATAQQQPTTSS